MVNTQLNLFLIFTIDGFIIGLLFDFFRILRKTIKTSDFITYIEDALFWILTGFIILYSIFKYNNGEIRFFMLMAIILGILAYMILISKFILKISLSIINFIKSIFHTIFNFIKIPFMIFMKLFKKLFFNPISFIIINIRNYFTKYFKNFSNLLKKTKISNKLVKNTKN